jgi:hypothetical protein
VSIVSQILGITGNLLKINKDGSIQAVVNTHPPLEEATTLIPFRNYFKNNGSIEMDVDGSVTPVDFTIEALQDRTITIKSLFITIVDAGATLSSFGNIGSLTNGLDFEWNTQDFGVVTIANEIQSNFDLISLGGGQPAFGDSGNAFKAQNVVGNEEAYISFVDFEKIFGFQYGIPLRRGTKDKLVFRINDDITGVTQFRAIAFGSEF